MGFRFRRSVKLTRGVRLNISKSGLSTSIGRPGATVNLGPRGARATVGLPGSGLSYSSFLPRKGGDGGLAPSRRQGCGCLVVILLLLLALGKCVGGSTPDDSAERAGSSASPSNPVAVSPAALGEASNFSVGDTVYVTVDSLNARAEPFASASVVDRLSSGSALSVIDRSGGWVKVAQGGRSFWVAAPHVSATAPARSSRPSTSERRAAAPSQAHPVRSSSYGPCPCSGRQVCVGPRGGRYCITSGGKKRYGV